MKITAALVLALAQSCCLAQTAESDRETEAPKLDLNAPLGSAQNPVRAYMPSGQREFLMRLRCPEGDAPAFNRTGSLGPGPYGSVVDSYRVVCASGRHSTIIMDMYQRHRELANVPGFTTLAELPARMAEGCPPQVPGTVAGTYVFHGLEVERPAFIEFRKITLTHPEVEGWVFVRLVVDATGRVDPATLDFPLKKLDPRLKELATDYLSRLQVEPALHKPGCTVRQSLEGGFTIKRAQ